MRILITAGPTREYLDDIRYLSNASSGRMGYALAEAALARRHEVILVSGPVELSPPSGCEYHPVETTAQMRDEAVACFADSDGVIAAAAVCDYKPRRRISGKIAKSGGPISIEMIETDDVLAELGACKDTRWVIGFALEAENARENALQKLRAKNCNLVVLNAPSAIAAQATSVELIDPAGEAVAKFAGAKPEVAGALVDWIETNIGSDRFAARDNSG